MEGDNLNIDPTNQETEDEREALHEQYKKDIDVTQKVFGDLNEFIAKEEKKGTV